MHGLLGPGNTVRQMALLRFLSASIEITAATIMLHYGRVETALAINSALGLVGPVLFALVSTLGLAHLAAGGVNPQKLAVIFLGILMVLWGVVR